MQHNITATTETQIPVTKLKHYPDNPRRGDIQAIAASLEHHGQYRPIVVQQSTNYVLAGNHTLKAARKLGWKTIAAVTINCDDETARKIVLADNRLNDLADYDQYALKTLLESLPDLNGTGFSQSDIAALDELIQDPFESPKDPSSRPDPSQDPEIKIGGYKFRVLKLAYEAWNDQIKNECDNQKELIRATIRDRLQIPEPAPTPKPAKPSTTTPPPVESNIELITAVQPHPDNARQGDIGEIVQSLQTFGQYRPIVANRTNKRILVGNHTYTAAVLLGWTHIAVTWVEVTETDEIKILLVDNRTSDLATYDRQELTNLLLKTVHNTTGTGYTAADLDEIQAGSTMKNQPIGKVTIKIGGYTMRISNDQLAQWSNTIQNWQDIPQRLQLPIEACTNYNGSANISDHDWQI